MEKYLKKYILLLMGMFVLFYVVSCRNKEKIIKVAEEISLANTVFNEVEFENSESVKIDQKLDLVIISGNIEEMSDAQKSVYGDDETTHVVVLKFMFDKEKTIDIFEIKGRQTKVYSSDSSVENYTGKLSAILDNDPEEDAFCYLILSANTKEYMLKATYTDSTSSTIRIKIDSTLISV